MRKNWLVILCRSKESINLLAQGVAIAAIVIMLLAFASMWVFGYSIGFDEDNLFLRTIETSLLIFGLVIMGKQGYKTVEKIYPQGRKETS